MKQLWIRLSMAFAGTILAASCLIPLWGVIILRVSGRPSLFEAVIKEGIIDASSLTPEVEERMRSLVAEEVGRNLIAVAVVMSGLGLIAGVTLGRRLAKPMHDLAEGARILGSGNLFHRVKPEGTQETIDVAEAFNQMAEQLLQQATLRQNLMADVAHELRTPLTVLQGNLRAILDDVYTMDKEEVTRLYDQTRHLSQLVEDLRLVALAEARQLPLNLETVDLIPHISQLAAGFEPISAEKEIKVTLDLPAEPLLATVDSARIKQVLLNLLSNALRHTPRGGSISIHAAKAGEEVRVAVRDSGEGIAAEHLAHIFERFYRTDPARLRESGGTGLGLAIARAIVVAHNGQVTVSSEGAGKGSTFTVVLKAAVPVSTSPGR
jgi:signal transduction histidine kinase